MSGPAHPADRRAQLLHLRVGAAALFGFAALGVVLESLHAFKAPWYLGVAGETRRFLWAERSVHGPCAASNSVGGRRAGGNVHPATGAPRLSCARQTSRQQSGPREQPKTRTDRR